ncbi:MAG TPA: HAMP domain-containing histidine kinase [Candidatus Dorea gallistercoris]|uniref:histidine kinase n=1 Tax=Candidatus Dorea gallistercoris TaxID=2838542 RepID=A0A9D1R8H7_9FIRM|nr:HAMP domain-containing histidine kinase [Candidatus Dorea gallistercoris]
MEIIIGILSIIILILAVILWRYQRQVKNICRQLAFLRENESNMMITGEWASGSLRNLTESLNEMIQEGKRQRLSYRKKEQRLSDTYTSLSHDIRTPLTSLDGYFQLLRESSDPEEQQRYLRIIEERVGSLKEMLEELFTFAKLKDETFHLELSLCCLNRILKECIFSYYEDWTKQGLEPKIQIPDEELYIEGNEAALRRVLQNVIKNSMDHGKERLFISLCPKEAGASLVVSNPVERPEEIDVEQVFERFYKADQARSRNSTGLGLAIAREFVLRMGGRIEAAVTGKEFQITLWFPTVDFPDKKL